MYRMLIVDDEPYILSSLADLFSGEPDRLEIYTASSGEKALEWLRKYRIDIVLTDIQMPGVTGLDLLAEIRGRWPHCQTIFLTGYHEFEYVRTLLRGGGVDYLLKTEDSSAILRAVDQAIAAVDEQRHASRQQALSESRRHKIVPLLQREYLLGLLRGQPSDLASRRQAFAENELPLSPEDAAFLLLVRVDRWRSDWTAHEKELMTFAIRNIAEEYFSPQACLAAVAVSPSKSAWLLQRKPPSGAVGGMVLEQGPEHMRGLEQVPVQEQKPVQELKQKPEQESEQKPGQAFEQRSEQRSERGSEQESERGSEQKPEQESEQRSGQASEQEQAQADPDQWLLFVKEYLSEIQATCNELLHVPVSFAVSSVPVAWEKLPEQAERLDRLLIAGPHMDANVIVMEQADDPAQADESPAALEADGFRSIGNLLLTLETQLESCKREEYAATLDEIVGLSGKLKPALFLQTYYAVASLLLKALNQWKPRGYSDLLDEIVGLFRSDMASAGMSGMWGELRQASGRLFDARASEAQAETDLLVAKLHRYIMAELDGDLSLPRLADVVYLNPVYLSRLYKQKTGIGLSDYIVNAKIAKAKELLAEAKWKVHEIAVKVGYDSTPSFTRFFKRLTNLSPQEYRDSIS